MLSSPELICEYLPDRTLRSSGSPPQQSARPAAVTPQAWSPPELTNGGGTAPSQAPTSQVPRTPALREMPRSSALFGPATVENEPSYTAAPRQVGASPASSAGLPAKTAMVGAGPPLFASGPR